MSAILVDTNVLVYMYDPTDGTKRSRARQVLEELSATELGALSTQVLGEFFVTVTRKIPSPLLPTEAALSIARYAESWVVCDVTSLIVLEALRGAQRFQLYYYDALIWATAKLNQMPYILTEDAEHNRVLEGIRYLNPFHPQFDLATIESLT